MTMYVKHVSSTSARVAVHDNEINNNYVAIEILYACRTCIVLPMYVHLLATTE